MQITNAAVPRRRPQKVRVDWAAAATPEALASGVRAYLAAGASLASGRPGSLWKETDLLRAALLEMVDCGLTTLSSQPPVKELKVWQRMYVTGLYASALADEAAERLCAAGFVVVVSGPAHSTLRIPAGRQSELQQLPLATVDDAPIILPDSLLALTLIQQGSDVWNPVTSIPLPLPLEALADLDAPVQVDDDGALWEHHITTSFGALVPPETLVGATADLVVVTVASAAFADSAATGGFSDAVLNVLRSVAGNGA